MASSCLGQVQCAQARVFASSTIGSRRVPSKHLGPRHLVAQQMATRSGRGALCGSIRWNRRNKSIQREAGSSDSRSWLSPQRVQRASGGSDKTLTLACGWCSEYSEQVRGRIQTANALRDCGACTHGIGTARFSLASFASRPLFPPAGTCRLELRCPETWGSQWPCDAGTTFNQRRLQNLRRSGRHDCRHWKEVRWEHVINRVYIAVTIYDIAALSGPKRFCDPLYDLKKCHDTHFDVLYLFKVPASFWRMSTLRSCALLLLQDIPRLAAEAAKSFPKVKFMVTAPIGVHSLVAEGQESSLHVSGVHWAPIFGAHCSPHVLQERLEQCVMHAAGKREECELCKGTDSCKMFLGGELAGENAVAAEDVNIAALEI
eukprot:1195636-Prorocentrum_minimum.AAC.7